VGVEEGVDPARLHNIQIPGQTPAVTETEKEPDDKDENPDGEETEAEPKKDGGLEKWLK
jgi:hypothetical protein